MAVIESGNDEDDDDDDDAEDSDDDREVTTSSIVDLLQPMVGAAVQHLVTGIMSGQIKLPSNLGEVFDWRKAAARGKKPTVAASAPTMNANPAPATAAPSASEPPKMKLEHAAHFAAIQQALGADAALARRAASKLTPDQLQTWFADLAELSVDDAVAKIRAEIEKSTGAGVES
jgi:hypothetical protein